MHDRFEDQILEMIEKFTERAGLLGAGVYRMDELEGGPLGGLLAGLSPPDNGWKMHAIDGRNAVGLFTPSRRPEHAIAVTFLTGAENAGGGEAGSCPDESARRFELLEVIAADLLEASDSGQAMQEYCSYLTRSYENMAMVYRLVQSLGKIGSAQEVVQQSLVNMVETLECDWAVAAFGHDPHLLGELSGRVFVASENPDKQNPSADAESLIERHGNDGNRVVAPEHNGGVGAVIQPIRLRATRVGDLVMAGKRSEEGDVSSFDTQLMEAVAACIASLLETIKLYEEQAATFIGTLRAFSSSLDAKDPYTRGHSERVALLGRQLALALGMSPDEAERVHLAGILHDIGKIGIPDRVLCKPGRLTDDEFGLIKRHPRTGYDILKPIPTVRDLLPGVLSHHERWDGRGYPDGLSGEGIPVMARILAIADTFDAMSSNRAYRPARGRDEVLAEIEKCAGSQFDPAMAPVFLSMDLAPFDEMLARHICEQVDTQASDGDSIAA